MGVEDLQAAHQQNGETHHIDPMRDPHHHRVPIYQTPRRRGSSERRPPPRSRCFPQPRPFLCRAAVYIGGLIPSLPITIAGATSLPSSSFLAMTNTLPSGFNWSGGAGGEFDDRRVGWHRDILRAALIVQLQHTVTANRVHFGDIRVGHHVWPGPQIPGIMALTQSTQTIRRTRAPRRRRVCRPFRPT